MPQLLLIYLQSSKVCWFGDSTLLGVRGQKSDVGWGKRGMDLNLKQNNHKSREFLGFDFLCSSRTQHENLLLRCMLCILRRMLRYLRKSSKLGLNFNWKIQATYEQQTLSLLFWGHFRLAWTFSSSLQFRKITQGVVCSRQ